MEKVPTRERVGMSRFMHVMISIPPNTSWIEGGNNILELICQKRRNQLNVNLMETLFFLAILKLPVIDAFSYSNKVDSICHIWVILYIWLRFFSFFVTSENDIWKVGDRYFLKRGDLGKRGDDLIRGGYDPFTDCVLTSFPFFKNATNIVTATQSKQAR